jgi:hypothetical protein
VVQTDDERSAPSLLRIEVRPHIHRTVLAAPATGAVAQTTNSSWR